MNPFVGARVALFDLDGTLVETHIDFPAMKREVLSMAESAGLEAAKLESQDILGIVESARTLIAKYRNEDDACRFRTEAFARLEEIEVEQCRKPNQIPGAAELLQSLKQRGTGIGIVTRNCRRVSLELIHFAGLRHDALITRDDVALTKPHPMHLEAALKVLGVEVGAVIGVMTGDHWMDVQAGKAASLATVGVLHGRDASFFEPAVPDLMAQKTGDLLALVQ